MAAPEPAADALGPSAERQGAEQAVHEVLSLFQRAIRAARTDIFHVMQASVLAAAGGAPVKLPAADSKLSKIRRLLPSKVRGRNLTADEVAALVCGIKEVESWLDNVVEGERRALAALQESIGALSSAITVMLDGQERQILTLRALRSGSAKVLLQRIEANASPSSDEEAVSSIRTLLGSLGVPWPGCADDDAEVQALVEHQRGTSTAAIVAAARSLYGSGGPEAHGFRVECAANLLLALPRALMYALQRQRGASDEHVTLIAQLRELSECVVRARISAYRRVKLAAAAPRFSPPLDVSRSTEFVREVRVLGYHGRFLCLNSQQAAWEAMRYRQRPTALALAPACSRCCVLHPFLSSTALTWLLGERPFILRKGKRIMMRSYHIDDMLPLALSLAYRAWLSPTGTMQGGVKIVSAHAADGSVCRELPAGSNARLCLFSHELFIASYSGLLRSNAAATVLRVPTLCLWAFHVADAGDRVRLDTPEHHIVVAAASGADAARWVASLRACILPASAGTRFPAHGLRSLEVGKSVDGLAQGVDALLQRLVRSQSELRAQLEAELAHAPRVPAGEFGAFVSLDDLSVDTPGDQASSNQLPVNKSDSDDGYSGGADEFVFVGSRDEAATEDSTARPPDIFVGKGSAVMDEGRAFTYVYGGCNVTRKPGSHALVFTGTWRRGRRSGFGELIRVGSAHAPASAAVGVGAGTTSIAVSAADPTSAVLIARGMWEADTLHGGLGVARTVSDDVVRGKFQCGELCGFAVIERSRGDERKYVGAVVPPAPGQPAGAKAESPAAARWIDPHRRPVPTVHIPIRDGLGAQLMNNGIAYVGEWSGDARCGRGCLLQEGTVVYEGHWEDNSYHGYGVLHSRGNGSRYVGEWKRGAMEGQGVLTYGNGDEYAGQFRSGRFHGIGTLRRANGEVKEGEWFDGQWRQHGVGADGDDVLMHIRGDTIPLARLLISRDNSVGNKISLDDFVQNFVSQYGSKRDRGDPAFERLALNSEGDSSTADFETWQQAMLEMLGFLSEAHSTVLAAFERLDQMKRMEKTLNAWLEGSDRRMEDQYDDSEDIVAIRQLYSLSALKSIVALRTKETLEPLFYRAFAREDEQLAQVYERISVTTMAELHMPTAVQKCLTGVGGELFPKSIAALQRLPDESSPYGKVACVVDAYRGISAFVAEASRGELRLQGADDEWPVLSYVLAQARVPRLFSQIAFMFVLAEDVCEDRMQRRGNDSYAVNTILSCVLYLSKLDRCNGALVDRNEVESALKRIEGVESAAVVVRAGQGASGRDAVCAAVVAEKRSTLAEMSPSDAIKYLSEKYDEVRRSGRFDELPTVHRFAVIDDLPVTRMFRSEHFALLPALPEDPWPSMESAFSL